MEEENSSDSEREVDQNELEAVLYSQIHFDSGFDIEVFCGSNNSCYQTASPFKIGVKELPTRITTNRRKLVFGGDFIAFSSNTCEEGNNSGSQNDAPLYEKDETAVIESRIEKAEKSKLEDVAPLRIDKLKSAVFPKKVTPLISCSSYSKPNIGSIDNMGVEAAVLDHGKEPKDSSFSSVLDGEEKFNVRNKSIALAKGENRTSMPKVKNKVKADDKKLKQKEALLPFSLTKKSLKPKVTQTEDILKDKVIKEACSEPIEKKKVSKQIRNNLAKLEGFLELSKSESDYSVIKCKKKAALRKTDAAVKLRKPSVILRRPPAVAVKYRQDSDTDTDYSDSDTSCNNSPMKARQTTLTDSSLNLSSSHDNLSSKDTGTQNVTAGVAQVIGARRFGNQVPDEHQELSSDIAVRGVEESAVSCSSDVNTYSEYETGGSDTDENVEDEKSEACVEEQGSSSQEEHTSDSNDTDSSDPEDFMTETISGLEFNLDKGVDVLVTARKPDDADHWKIDEKDRHNMVKTLSRYFIPKVIQCRNCKAEGHMSWGCPQPLKRRCIFCGVEGHAYQACPNAICFNCNAPGHRFTDCKERKQKRDAMCSRCWMPSHQEEQCPDRWRQYHITVSTKGSHLMTAPKDARNPLVFCYNCGEKGHLGYECRLPRMNRFVPAAYPFIARYDTKNKRKEMRGDVGGSSKTGRSRDDCSIHSEGPKKKQSRGHGESEKASSAHKMSYRQDREEELNGRKRDRKKNQQIGKEHKSSRSERNILSGQGIDGEVFARAQKSSYVGHKRTFEGNDDMLNDFNNHQVNDNQWWAKNDKPSKKRRKRNTETFSSHDKGNDWQRDMQREGMQGAVSRTFQRSRANRAENMSQGDRGEWRKNKQQQRAQGKQGHKVQVPEFSRKQRNDYHYRGNESIPQEGGRRDGQFSNYKPNKGQMYFDHSNTKQAQLSRAASWPSFQQADSNFWPNRNGFQAHNNRFVAMKKNCDISVRLRK